MCVSAAGRVISIEPDGGVARVDVGGRVRRASLWLEPGTATGDWVEVGAGVVLRRLSEAEAAELIDLTRVLTEGDVP
jgi:hydrogenase maturation factor